MYRIATAFPPADRHKEDEGRQRGSIGVSPLNIR
jgi:hypothetical protein